MVTGLTNDTFLPLPHLSGVHRGPREGHGDLLRHPAQQRHDVRRVHGGGVREGQSQRAPLRNPLQLQPLLLPEVHPQVEERQAVRKQNHQVSPITHTSACVCLCVDER